MAPSSIQPFVHNRHGPKTGGSAPFRGSYNPIQQNVAWAEVYLCTKWHLDPSGPLAIIDMGQKSGGGCALFIGEAGSPSNTKSHGSRPISIPSGILVHPVVWRQLTLAENWGLCMHLALGEGELSPRLRPISVPNDIPIPVHTTVWPQ